MITPKMGQATLLTGSPRSTPVRCTSFIVPANWAWARPTSRVSATPWIMARPWWSRWMLISPTRLQVRDTTAGFKVFRREVLENLDLSHIRSHGYTFMIEMAYACQQAGYRVCEVPIFFNDRVVGNSKMDLSIMWEAVWRVWQMRFQHRR